MTNILPRLKLRSPESTDPFDIGDFQFNLALLDAAPGLATGLSSARPVWDAGQAGRAFLETDTRRIIYWSGSAWVDPIMVGESFSGVLTSPTLPGSLAPSTTFTYNFPTITLTRPARLVGTLSVNWEVQVDENASMSMRFLVDAADAHVFDMDAVMNATSTTPSGSIHRGSTTVSIRSAVLTVGVHTPKFRVVSNAGNSGGFVTVASYAAYETL